MKKIFLLSLFISLIFNQLSAQVHNNVRLFPKADSICYGTELYLWIAGNSFQPISYVWSTGDTTPTIQATSSGLYSLTVYGYLGNSNKDIVLTRYKYFTVMDKPIIDPITPTWVCKNDTVKLQVESGYDSYIWNNGSTNLIFERQMTGSNGGQVLDTVSVWYTAFKNGLCEVNSDTIVIRGIRRPQGVAAQFEGRTNLTVNDSIKAALVLTYIYPPQYEMEFTKVNDPNYVVNWITPTTTRSVPLNILDANSPSLELYNVRTRPIINNVTYCWGSTSTIGIVPTPRNNDVSFTNRNDITEPITYQFYDLGGRFIFERRDYRYNNEWLREYPNQFFLVIEKENMMNGSQLKMFTN